MWYILYMYKYLDLDEAQTMYFLILFYKDAMKENIEVCLVVLKL
jgi:hypothetical protein